MKLQQDTAISIANLATSTASDRSTISNISDTNSALAANLAITNYKLQEFQSTIADITHQVTILRDFNGHYNQKAPFPDIFQQVPNNNYCWTHSYRVNKNHDSTSCRNPAHGHQNTATQTDNMSGSQMGKELHKLISNIANNLD